MRKTTLGAAVLALALPLAACGGEEDTGGARAAGDDPAEGALKFAKCMREQGIDFPDPQVSGNGERGTVRMRPGPGFNPDDPRTEKARKACEEHLPRGEDGPRISEEQRAALQDGLLAFARCMRGEGIDMPDPEVGGNGAVIQFRRRGQGGPNPDSAKFQAAEKKCQPIMRRAHEEAGIEGPRVAGGRGR